MDMVNKNFKQVDDSLMRMQFQARAKYATEFIRQFYLGEKAQFQNSSAGTYNTGENNNMGGNQKIIKGYLEKLILIEEEASREKIRLEIQRFAQMDKNSNEYSKVNTYLDEVFNVPWQKYTPPYWDINYAQQVLKEEIYGLQKVKERIIQMIAINQIRNCQLKSKGFVLLLQGPPGTGKTSIAKTIAKALKKESRFISFAGISDKSFFKGHKRTYIDSQPGIFIKELIKAQTMNPVFILDEVDKISRSNSGADPYYSLLEILNPEENGNFQDHYLDIKVDFSNVIFILTSNNLLNILQPLKNRLEIIEIPPYIEEEKIQIAQNYIFPKVLLEHGLKPDFLLYNTDFISYLIKNWCYDEPGVRGLKRLFETICRKYVVTLVEKYGEKIKKEGEIYELDEQMIKNKEIEILDLKKIKEIQDILLQYLGPPTFDNEKNQRIHQKFMPGAINILSVAGFVGEVLKLECVFFNDFSDKETKGVFTATGNIQQVLQESLKIAKINAFQYLNEEQQKSLEKNNIHVHFLNAATPKDGPSAGTAICTSIISLISGFQIPATLAMTGELGLLGDVCKIGGLQAKIIGAKSVGIDQIISPYANINDCMEFPKELLEDISIYFVKEYKQIYQIVFQNNSDGIITLKNGDFVNNIISYNANNLDKSQQQNISY
ncbi:hypothetical protein IMG5_124880 [Ichthyophthirius multifiliis]|uniref:Lon proteolytic domain-containing protein n=1 Tax=Ichthyophthirius multifiliis TaxID=5932 RepID=G0QVN4_ICHMU|nr:hypothetical protein IMG5_124880 [Ichthyophthirius multifiliis]EGR30721.1 hypothetical protein IMG5_124880 [Ichthyophthirius multifiliis]|eukprot:XP_004032308.1 hypothetical protein IMG5_124880 [Ichthyophthirius multifiliis]